MTLEPLIFLASCRLTPFPAVVADREVARSLRGCDFQTGHTLCCRWLPHCANSSCALLGAAEVEAPGEGSLKDEDRRVLSVIFFLQINWQFPSKTKLHHCFHLGYFLIFYLNFLKEPLSNSCQNKVHFSQSSKFHEQSPVMRLWPDHEFQLVIHCQMLSQINNYKLFSGNQQTLQRNQYCLNTRQNLFGILTF